MNLIIILTLCLVISIINGLEATSKTVLTYENFSKDPDRLVNIIESINENEWTLANLQNDVKKTGKLQTSADAIKNPSCSFYIGSKAQDLSDMFQEINLDKENALVTQVYFGRYSKRHYMHNHTDDATNKINHRYYKRNQAFILYLTKDWQEKDGGQLKYYVNDTGYELLPKYNMLATFKVGILHEVLEVLAEDKDRLTIYGWFMRKETQFEGFQRTPFYQILFSTQLRLLITSITIILLGIFLRICSQLEDEPLQTKKNK